MIGRLEKRERREGYSKDGGGKKESVRERKEVKGEVESESIISEAVLNRALRQDVLYMLMTHTYSPQTLQK